MGVSESQLIFISAFSSTSKHTKSFVFVSPTQLSLAGPPKAHSHEHHEEKYNRVGSEIGRDSRPSPTLVKLYYILIYTNI